MLYPNTFFPPIGESQIFKSKDNDLTLGREFWDKIWDFQAGYNGKYKKSAKSRRVSETIQQKVPKYKKWGQQCKKSTKKEPKMYMI